MTFAVGDTVTWISSGTWKRGVITDIVPAGKTPADIGRPKAGGGGGRRKHDSYVIHGRKVYGGIECGSKAYYWPVVSLIERAG